jgi:hypothetical protein
MTPPTFIDIRRREPNMGREYDGPNISLADAPLVYDPHGAPDPIRQSAYWDTGKAPGTRWSRVPVALHFAIPSILGVMRDDFAAGKVRAQFLTFMQNGLGGQLAWTERPNIDPGSSQPYGNLTGVFGSGDAYGAGGRVVAANGLTYDRRRR